MRSTDRNIELTFKCPVKWGSMQPSADGRYCAQCKKTVKDLTGSSVQEIAAAEKAEAHACGSFYATQLHKPFGDWRDGLISYYQRLQKRTSPQRFALLCITLLLFLSGCRSRRLEGAYSSKGWDYKGSTAAVPADSVKENSQGIK